MAITDLISAGALDAEAAAALLGVRINSDSLGKVRRLFTEDLVYWLAQPDKKPLLQQMREAADLWHIYRFPPYQYLKHDLYLRGVGEEYRDFVPNVLADAAVPVLNPSECARWLEDKVEFERRMKAANMPIIANFAFATVKDGAFSVVDELGAALSFEEFFALAKRKTQRAMFIKPRFGGQGIGAYRVVIGADGFERDGAAMDAGAFHDLLAPFGFEDYMLAPFFEQHEELARVNSKSVNTLRVVTFLDEGEFEIVGAALRVGCGKLDTDNLSLGGYAVNVDLGTGALGAIGKVALEFSKQRAVDRHPVSNVLFADVKLPYWAEVVNLVERGSRMFAPIRHIGWDIALGADGPVVIEANYEGGLLTIQDVGIGLRPTKLGRRLAELHNWR